MNINIEMIFWGYKLMTTHLKTYRNQDCPCQHHFPCQASNTPLAKDCIFIENICKQRFEEASTSPNLLNTTNLYERPICLKSIIVARLCKIHKHFLNPLTYLKRQRLTSNNTFSTFESNFLTFEKSLSPLGRVEICASFVDVSNKDVDMRNNDYDKQLSLENSNVFKLTQQDSIESEVFQLNSKKLNNIKKSSTNKTVVAKSFITKNKITKKNLSKSLSFKKLDQDLKQAIYYQLRKISHKENVSTQVISISKEKKSPLNIQGAALLMLPVIFTEIIVLGFSYLFYLQLGFSVLMSALAAASVELFFMITSMSKQRILKSLRWLIFAYSAFTVSYSTYVSDPALKSIQANGIMQLKTINFQLEKQKETSIDINHRKKDLLSDMKIYRSKEMITIGHKRLLPERISLEAETLKNEKKITLLASQMTRLNLLASQSSIFSKGNLKIVSLRTWSVIAFLMLIQLLSTICASEFAQSYSAYRKKKSKLKSKNTKHNRDINTSKRRESDDLFHQTQSSYIN